MKKRALTFLWLTIILGLNHPSYAQNACQCSPNGQQIYSCAESSCLNTHTAQPDNCLCQYGRTCYGDNWSSVACHGTASAPQCSVYGNNCPNGTSPYSCIEADGNGCSLTTPNECACAPGRFCGSNSICENIGASSNVVQKSLSSKRKEPLKK